MNSFILQTATRYLLPLILLFSVFLLLRGHHEPGGGFVGGLVAAAALILYAIAFDVPSARRLVRIDPHVLLGVGLLTALASGLWSLAQGQPLMTGRWTALPLPGEGYLDLGTPLLFDLGVYLVVLGTCLTIILSLAEE